MAKLVEALDGAAFGVTKTKHLQSCENLKEFGASQQDIHLLHEARHPNPHTLLGCHKIHSSPYFIIRAWVREAEEVYVYGAGVEGGGCSVYGLPQTWEKSQENEEKSDENEEKSEKTKEKIEENKEKIPENEKNGGKLRSGENISAKKSEEVELKKNEKWIPNGTAEQENRKGNIVKIDLSKKNQVKYILFANNNQPAPLAKTAEWLFEGLFSLSHGDLEEREEVRYMLKIRRKGEQNFECISDPYSFGPILFPHDLKRFASGSCWNVDELLGSHYCEVGGMKGVRFSVWAPGVDSVSVVGDWNGWEKKAHPLLKREGGVWEIFISHYPRPGHKYKYHIHSNHQQLLKIDPYAQEFEVPPATASIISGADDPFKPKEERFKWEDKEWMEKREKLGQSEEIRRTPVAIYEVHLPSWRRHPSGAPLNYRELAPLLVEHVQKFNFTHVEFMPITQFPYWGSWGYQVSGYYGPYSGLGGGEDLKFLVNELHKANIGVFLDFVMGHFCPDDFGLPNFIGSPLYEYADPREGRHLEWGTNVFNYGRGEVRSFLLGAAYHWLRRYHIDGLRIDAVSSMIYRDYQRPHDQWIPNILGGTQNLEAISLLQELNWVIRKEFVGCLVMAEESTSWQGVTSKEGLNFHAKWDLGWMNDVLSYLSVAPHDKHNVHYKIVQRSHYGPTENWVMPLSHDEVVHGKGSLVSRCGFTHASFEDRLQNLKVLYGMQIGLPGRPLIFMGCEIAQGGEWRADGSVAWEEWNDPNRKGVSDWLSNVLRVYTSQKALHAGDDENWNFEWVDCNNPEKGVLCFLRKFEDWRNDVIVLCNFSVHKHENYPIGVHHDTDWKVLLNSDDSRYKGHDNSTPMEYVLKPSPCSRDGFSKEIFVTIHGYSCIYLVRPQNHVI